MKTQFFTLTQLNESQAQIVFDMKDSPVNKLSTAALEEFDKVLDEVKSLHVEQLLIKSAKSGIFIAGADIKEIEMMHEEEAVMSMLGRGNRVFEKLETLPLTSVAIIEGACMGGGFELALACDFRLAIDSPKTKLALPEVKLGVMPGLGGTQRLPKLIGLQRALGIILKGDAVDAKKALKLGMVDAVVPQGYEAFQIPAFLQQLCQAKMRKILRKKRNPTCFLDSIKLYRDFVFKMATKSVMSSTKGHYPAPLQALKTIQSTWSMSLDEGLKVESKAFASLATGAISKHLISLFFSTESVKSKKFTADPLPIKHTAVIGGGVMGQGIIWLFANAKRNVRVKLRRFVQAGSVAQALYDMFKFPLKRGKITKQQLGFRLGGVTYTEDYRGFKGIDVAVEAIIEDKEAKAEVFADLEAVMSDTAIIATNTSSISVNTLSETLKHPERFVGLHFFNPVNRMPLVEIIPSQKTSQQTIATMYAWMQEMGKTPIVVGDCAGFLVNRLLIPYVNEALHLLSEGVAMERIDEALINFGMPVGPIELVDTVGIDIGHHVLAILHDAYGERMASASIIAPVYDDLKLLGKKSGKGFYMYDKKGISSPNPDVLGYLPAPVSMSEEAIVERTLLVMINEASRALEEGIVRDAKELDLAMIMGCGFPPFRGGLLAYADTLGSANVHASLMRLSKTMHRFTPSVSIAKMAQENLSFY